jgi:hypothetical protein
LPRARAWRHHIPPPGGEWTVLPPPPARKRSDAEIFERFPLWIVPTYPGDDRLFASDGFRAWLPDDLPFEHATLGEVMAVDEKVADRGAAEPAAEAPQVRPSSR